MWSNQAVPYIGIFLTDLTFLDESDADFVEIQVQKKLLGTHRSETKEKEPLLRNDQLINFEKLMRAHERIAELKAMQALHYDFIPQSMVQAYLHKAAEWDEHEICQSFDFTNIFFLVCLFFLYIFKFFL